jgi:Tfp pilus assembly protein PilV
MMPSRQRLGLSLLEVLTALAIFLGAFVVIGQLITMSGERALEVQQQSRAAQLCQSKLAEVLVGSVPLTQQGDTPFEEDPDWHWSLDVDTQSITNLSTVTVKVNRQRSDGTKVECVLNQMVLNPSQRGSTIDIAAAAAAAKAASSASASSGGSSSSSSSSDSSSGGSMQRPTGSGASPGGRSGAGGGGGASPPSGGAPPSGGRAGGGKGGS